MSVDLRSTVKTLDLVNPWVGWDLWVGGQDQYSFKKNCLVPIVFKTLYALAYEDEWSV